MCSHWSCVSSALRNKKQGDSGVCLLSSTYLSCKVHIILEMRNERHIRDLLEVGRHMDTFVFSRRKKKRTRSNTAFPEAQSRRMDNSHPYEWYLCLINFNLKSFVRNFCSRSQHYKAVLHEVNHTWYRPEVATPLTEVQHDLVPIHQG